MIEQILSSPLSITIFVVSVMVGWTLADIIIEHYQKNKSKAVKK